MDRVKTFDATGVAPNGRLYAGDLNMIQDAAAALTDLTQNLQVSTLAVGEAGLQISRYGAGEALISGALRASGILRGLGGMMAGTFTTAQRDAIAAGSRPYGLLIVNTTNNRYEWNSGTDAAPNWQPVSPPIAAGSIGTTELADGSVTSAKIADGTIVNADIAAGAAIAISKLAGFPNDATKHLKGDGTWDYVHGAEIAALTISDVHIAAAAAIAQTKIASVLGLASLSADVNYLKGNSGAINVNDSIVLPNGKSLLGADTGGTARALIGTSGNSLVIGPSPAFSDIEIGRGQAVGTLHSTGNWAFAIDPNYGGGGKPGLVIYNSAGSTLGRIYTDGANMHIADAAFSHEMVLGGAGITFPGSGVGAGGSQNFTATPLQSYDLASHSIPGTSTWTRVDSTSITIPRAGSWAIKVGCALAGANQAAFGIAVNGVIYQSPSSNAAPPNGLPGVFSYPRSCAAGDVVTIMCWSNAAGNNANAFWIEAYQYA